ncbi:hypothetical protein [Plantactinospora sp. WMMB782]|uniref:hypothetical protein n=1 Tax=Plantactinospora sp. WMMB782 TaxID=3404121 RepID=UPI003B947F83
MNSFQIAGRLTRGALTDGGATVPMDGGEVPGIGYMVGVGGIKLLAAQFSEAQLEERIRHWADSVRLSTGLAADRLYLGSWLDEGLIYLDISEHYQSEALALAVAEVRGEKAIYSLATGVSIDVAAPVSV